jgi:hypothetical protein
MEKTPLGTTLLGKTGPEVTRVGPGACAIGDGGLEMGSGLQVDDDSVTAIHAALEPGVDWIDTAAAYGFGHSERAVGCALPVTERGNRRSRLLPRGVGTAQRGDDSVADRRAAPRRLACARPTLAGAAAVAPSRPGLAPSRGRRPPRHDPGRGRDRLALGNRAIEGAIVGFRRADPSGPLVRTADLRPDASDIATIERTAS